MISMVHAFSWVMLPLLGEVSVPQLLNKVKPERHHMCGLRKIHWCLHFLLIPINSICNYHFESSQPRGMHILRSQSQKRSEFTKMTEKNS